MKLYNTLSRKVEDFVPLDDKNVKMYTCGLTVYSQPQIGNWVAYIYADVLTRTLKASGYKVNRVQNITDVGHLTDDADAGEDKMLKGALKEGKTAWEVAEKFIKIADDEAYNQLKLQHPNHMPRATEYIDQQIKFVEALEEKGFTYAIADGVYFDTSKLRDYGKLAKLDIKGLEFGARVADTGKKNSTDFALWKFSPKDQKRDMEWPSPWGIGFPGWHLECSVMARELLGDQLDLHTGGIDHIPVHHTNEIAQSEGLTGEQLSKYWFHNNHMKVDGTKLSKSLGNSYTLDDIKAKGYSLDAFKLLVLSSHYRTEGNFTWEILEAAQNRLNNWFEFADLKWQIKPTAELVADSGILAELQNDLDTPKALAKIDHFVSVFKNKGKLANYKSVVKLLDEIKAYLGIDLARSDISDEQKAMIKNYELARYEKSWQTSDALRKTLLDQNIVLNDTKNGTVWNRI